MNPLDIIIAAVVGYGLYLGGSKGIVKGLTNIVTIGASIILGWRFRPAVQTFMTEYESLRFGLEGQTLAFASFAISFVLCYLLVSSVLGYAKKILDALPMGLNLDKALGALTGGFLATFALSFILMMGSTIGVPSEQNTRNSLLFPMVRGFSKTVLGILPSAANAASEKVQEYAPARDTDANGAPAAPAKPKGVR